MSLARTLMDGGYVGNLGSINPARYGHDQGATVIAMESIEELHEIFLESYNYEQADLAAAIEGVCLEGSQYEAVAEAAITSAFAKIKEFFVSLWNKVKAFFHAVKRYIDSILLSGKDFCKRYKKEIDKLDNIKDLTVKMFEYNDDEIENGKSVDTEELTKDLTDEVSNLINKADTADKLKDSDDLKGKRKAADTKEFDKADKLLEDVKKADEEYIYKEQSDGKATDAEDFDKYLFGLFRKNAETAEDKEERDLSGSDIKDFANKLANSNASKNVDEHQRKCDKAYRDAIKLVDSAEKKFSGVSGSKTASKIAEVLRAYSSFISRQQNVENKYINAWKTAVKERDGAYKSAIMAAFSNNRKNLKKES